jgi:hypothetical protein
VTLQLTLTVRCRIIAFALSRGALRLAWQGGKSSKGKAMTRLVVLGVRGDGALVDHGRKEAFVDVRCAPAAQSGTETARGAHCEPKPACAETAHRGGDGNSVAPLQCEAFATAFGGLPAAARIQWDSRKGKARQGKAHSRRSSRRHGSALQRQRQ